LKQIRETRRRFSHTVQFAVRSGDWRREVFVKIPTESAQHQFIASRDAESMADRPRLVPVISVAEEVRWEHTSLSRMGKHFATTGHPSIGCPRILDLINQRAIVTEGIAAPTVSVQLINRRVSDAYKVDVLQKTGRWLRTFHHMPPHSSAMRRLVSRDELSKSACRFISYLRHRTSQSASLKRIGQSLDRQLQEVVPKSLEPVCGHGDFGPHNLLIDGERLIGLDTLANWQTSRFEDIAYFLLLIETTQPLFRPRFRLGGMSMSLARQSFLEGYFHGEPIPKSTLAWFEALVALDKWASVVHSTRRSTGVRRVVKRMRMTMQQTWLHNRIEQACEQFTSRDSMSEFAFDPSTSGNRDASQT